MDNKGRDFYPKPIVNATRLSIRDPPNHQEQQLALVPLTEEEVQIQALQKQLKV